MKFFAVILLTILAVVAATPQTPPSKLAGTVTAVDAAGKQISLKTDQGETVTFTVSDKTQVVHAQAGETDTKKWPHITLSEIGAGDQALAYYRGALDQKPLLASTLVIRSKADLAELAKKQMDEWKTRGTSGIVASVDPAAKTITLKVGSRNVTVQPGDKVLYRRYSPDSAKPADARPGTFADIQAGDQLNVLGNKNADGTVIQAETIYSGNFRQIAATINSIDTASGEMKVTDLATKKPLTIRVTPESNMKKLPEQMAQGLARRYQGGGGGGVAGPPRGGPGGGRGGDVGQMLERLPSISLSDLKPKDAIMISTTSGSDPGRVTAINLLAGVEPLLTASPNATRDIMSGWNLGGGGGEGQ